MYVLCVGSVVLGYSECVCCVGSVAVVVVCGTVLQCTGQGRSGDCVWTFGATSVPLACIHCLMLVVLNVCLCLCNCIYVLCVCMCVVLAEWCSWTGSQPVCPGYCP